MRLEDAKGIIECLESDLEEAQEELRELKLVAAGLASSVAVIAKLHPMAVSKETQADIAKQFRKWAAFMNKDEAEKTRTSQSYFVGECKGCGTSGIHVGKVDGICWECYDKRSGTT